jgi:ATPase subunit of ABC transporter with duplicated ATPase domains
VRQIEYSIWGYNCYIEMSILEVKNINYSVANKVLYQNASFAFNKGDHLGIVGQNGAGKTTLINILIGRIELDQGEIEWTKNIKVGYLDQHAEIETNITIFNFLKKSFNDLYEDEKKLNEIYGQMTGGENDAALGEKAETLQNRLIYTGFYDLDSVINKVAAGLGIAKLGMETLLSNLSGGQRAKVILAKLLLEKPDVLLMDEPTNFLDKEHVEWLGKYLKNFEGSFIVISHDFDFLNEITNCIIDIEFKQVKKYTGNFQQFLALKEENKKNYEREFEKQQKEITHLQAFISRFGAGTRASMAQSRQKKLDKIEVMPPAQSLPKPQFNFVSQPIGTGVILNVNNLLIGYSNPLLPEINLTLNGGEKIVINGFNGIGKSTLIKTLVGIIPPLGGEFK